jgi:AcrR family transcriptional regulator
MSWMEPTPALAEGKATRDLILDVAERRFAERGFAGVTVRDIAAEIGFKNQASLYYHFQSKRSLYEAVIARGLGHIVTLLTEYGGRAGASSSASPQASLEAGVDRFVDYLIEHRHLATLLQRAGLDDSLFLRRTLQPLLAPVYAQALRVLGTLGTVSWTAEDLPFLATGLYHLIFGAFANSNLHSAVMDQDLWVPGALAQQRSFLKKAVTRLLFTPSL